VFASRAKPNLFDYQPVPASVMLWSQSPLIQQRENTIIKCSLIETEVGGYKQLPIVMEYVKKVFTEDILN
jgi:hypothetical protein